MDNFGTKQFEKQKLWSLLQIRDKDITERKQTADYNSAKIVKLQVYASNFWLAHLCGFLFCLLACEYLIYEMECAQETIICHSDSK